MLFLHSKQMVLHIGWPDRVLSVDITAVAFKKHSSAKCYMELK